MFQLRRLALVCLLLALVAIDLRAQQPPSGDRPRDMIDRIFSAEFRWAPRPPVRWSDGGASYIALEPAAGEGGGTDIVRYNTATGGNRRVLVTAAQLTPAGAKAALRIDALSWSSDGNRVLIFTNAQRVWCRDHAALAQPAQVVGDEALALPRQVAQLADTPIAARQLAQQPPAQRVARELQERRKEGAAITLRDDTSNQLDSFSDTATLTANTAIQRMYGPSCARTVVPSTHQTRLKEGHHMNTYVIEREIAGPASSPTRSARHHHHIQRRGGDANKPYEWLHSYVAGDKIYCFHKAESADVIREHAKEGGFPANLVQEVTAVFDRTGPRDLPV